MGTIIINVTKWQQRKGHIMKTFKDYRKAKGYSQEILARLAKVSRISVRRYEEGERIPDINTAARFGKILDIPDDELLRMFGEASA